MQLEFVIHGVPQGHQTWGTSSDKYYETFYGKYDIYRKAKNVFVVEVRENAGTRSCYYSLIHPQNVLAAGGRPGSYFGMSLRVDGNYCTDVYSLFHLFEIAFNQYIATHLLSKIGESEQFMVEDLNTVAPALTEAKKYILSQIQSHLNAEFEAIDETFTKKNVQIIEYYNPDDTNSETFFNSTRLDGKVLISPEYPTKDNLLRSYRAKEQQAQESIKSGEEKIETLSKENSSLKQYKDSVNSLKSEVSKLKEQNQQLSTSLATEKNASSSYKSQVTSLKNQVEQLKNSANIQKIAGDLEKSMSDMLPILRSIAPKNATVSERQERLYNPKDHSHHDNHTVKDKGLFRYLVIVLAIILLVCLFFLIKGIKSGPKISELKKEKQELIDKYDRLEKDYNSLKSNYDALTRVATPNVVIDVDNFSGSDMEMGKRYTISVKGYDGPGEWVVDGFELNGSPGDKQIKVRPSKTGEIHISYKINGQVVKTRPFYIKEK